MALKDTLISQVSGNASVVMKSILLFGHLKKRFSFVSNVNGGRTWTSSERYSPNGKKDARSVLLNWY